MQKGRFNGLLFFPAREIALQNRTIPELKDIYWPKIWAGNKNACSSHMKIIVTMNLAIARAPYPELDRAG